MIVRRIKHIGVLLIWLLLVRQWWSVLLVLLLVIQTLFYLVGSSVFVLWCELWCFWCIYSWVEGRTARVRIVLLILRGLSNIVLDLVILLILLFVGGSALVTFIPVSVHCLLFGGRTYLPVAILLELYHVNGTLPVNGEKPIERLGECSGWALLFWFWLLAEGDFPSVVEEENSWQVRSGRCGSGLIWVLQLLIFSQPGNELVLLDQMRHPNSV